MIRKRCVLVNKWLIARGRMKYNSLLFNTVPFVNEECENIVSKLFLAMCQASEL
jgi:hypothetical protein